MLLRSLGNRTAARKVALYLGSCRLDRDFQGLSAPLDLGEQSETGREEKVVQRRWRRPFPTQVRTLVAHHCELTSRPLFQLPFPRFDIDP